MVTTTTEPKTNIKSTVGRLVDVVFPNGTQTVSQDQEYCTVLVDGVTKKIRFHDYDQVYNIPGLYEEIFYDHLGCKSPDVVGDLFHKQLKQDRVDSSSLSVLEIGAGNGMVAQKLQDIGVDQIVGIDILLEAKLAAFRDRPGLYEDYYAMDLTDIPMDIEENIRKKRLNTLVSVAALGFDDIPPLAYANAFNLIENNGWVAFNIKEDLLENSDSTGFSRLLRQMVDSGKLEILNQFKYTHRRAVSGEPLDYYAIIAKKHAAIPREWVPEL
jgi:predicted TPR repeat methyltransferase